MPASSNPPSTTPPSTILISRSFATPEFPMVLLDLNFVIMKTNSKFRQLMTGGNEVRGYSLENFLGPNTSETIRQLRIELREEREAREPSYLPPIVTPGEQGAVEAITEENLDLVTSDYTNRSEMLTFRLSGGQAQTMSTRIRLARTSVFFVALAAYPSSGGGRLPTWQQPQHTQSSDSTEKLRGHYSVPQHSPQTFAHASPFQSFQSLSTSLPPITTATSSSIPLSPTSGYEYSRSHSATPIAFAPPSTGLNLRPESPYNTHSMRRDIISQRVATPVYQQPQLPPIAGMIPGSREPSEQASVHQERSQRSGSGPQERQDPDPEPKRRRLDISDVLE